MKTTQLLITGIAATVAFTMTVNAENKDGNKGKGKHRRGAPKHIIEKFDKDGDGKLNEEELTALKADMQKRREARKAKMLKRFDADKDGKLSEEERKTARETMAKERKEIKAAALKEFDKDGDGKLSKDERTGVREWIKKNYPDAMPMFRHRPGRKGGRGRGGPPRN